MVGILQKAKEYIIEKKQHIWDEEDTKEDIEK